MDKQRKQLLEILEYVYNEGQLDQQNDERVTDIFFEDMADKIVAMFVVAILTK